MASSDSLIRTYTNADGRVISGVLTRDRCQFLDWMTGPDVVIICFQRLAVGLLDTDETVLFCVGDADKPDGLQQRYAIFVCNFLLSCLFVGYFGETDDVLPSKLILPLRILFHDGLVFIDEGLAKVIFQTRESSKLPGFSNTCRVFGNEIDAETNLVMIKSNSSLRPCDESLCKVTTYRTGNVRTSLFFSTSHCIRPPLIHPLHAAGPRTGKATKPYRWMCALRNGNRCDTMPRYLFC